MPRGRGLGANFGWNCFEGTQSYPGAPPSCTPLAAANPIAARARIRDIPPPARARLGDGRLRDPRRSAAVAARPLHLRRHLQHLRRPAAHGPALRGRLQRRFGLGVSATNVVSFGEDACAHIYVATIGGTVYRLEPTSGPFPCSPQAPAKTEPTPGPAQPPPTTQPSPAATTCSGERATIVGTQGRDVLRGSARRDVIAGLGGNDRLSGLEGNDLICGGKGRDTIRGGAGKDRLRGQTGNDILLSRDRRPIRERVDCGRGFDRVVRDRLDRLVGCEKRLRDYGAGARRSGLVGSLMP